MNLGARQTLMVDAVPYDSKVEYIDTNGAYIITSTCLNEIDNLCIKFHGVLLDWTEHQVIGNFPSQTYFNNNSAYGFRLIANSGSRHYYVDNGYRRIRPAASWSINNYVELNILISPTPYCTINNTQISIDANEVWNGKITTNPISLCAFYDGTGERSRIKIYKLVLEQNNIEKMNLIPVRKNTIGYLYDTISKSLLSPIGNSFLYGPDI